MTQVRLEASTQASVDVVITSRDLAHWDPKVGRDGEYVVDPGDYMVYVCRDSRGLKGSDQGGAEGLPTTSGCLEMKVTL